MSEQELIEQLGRVWPQWRDHYDNPFDAADNYGIDWRGQCEEDYGDYEELDFAG